MTPSCGSATCSLFLLQSSLYIYLVFFSRVDNTCACLGFIGWLYQPYSASIFDHCTQHITTFQGEMQNMTNVTEVNANYGWSSFELL